MGSFKKYITCIMAFCTPFNFVTFCQFYFIPSPVLITNFQQETIEWEKRIVFGYMAVSVYQVISKEVENSIFRHNRIFRNKCVDKQPTLTKLHEKPSFLCHFLLLSSSTSSPFPSDILGEWSPIKTGKDPEGAPRGLDPLLKFNI